MERLAQGADLIVLGRVAATPRTSGTERTGGAEATIEVERILKGPRRAGSTLVVRLPPSPESAGASSRMWSVSLGKGERVLLFLRRDGRTPGAWSFYGGAQAKWLLLPGGRVAMALAPSDPSP